MFTPFEERAKIEPDRYEYDDIMCDWYDNKLHIYESDVDPHYGDLWRKYINPFNGHFDPDGKQAVFHRM